MNKKISLLAVLLFLFVSKTNAQLLSEEPIRFHKSNTENGLIFGSITFPDVKTKFDGYLLWLSCKEDGKELWQACGKIYLKPKMFKAKHKGELDGGKTYLFAIEKPPGQYSISGIRLIILKVGLGGTIEGPSTDIVGFTIPFDVKKGEITYIGNINIDEYALKTDLVMSIKDEFQKDKNALKNLQKFVNWDAATKSEIKMIRN